MKYYTSYPTTDRRVYYRKGSSLLFERGAELVEIDEEEGYTPSYSTVFIDVDGILHNGYEPEWIDSERYDRYGFVGIVGETVPPRKLGSAWDNLEVEVDEMLEDMEGFFKLDKSQAEDVLVVRLDNKCRNEFEFSFMTEWYGFPTCIISRDTLENLREGKEIEEEAEKSIRKNFIRPLVHYCNYLEKIIQLDVDFGLVHFPDKDLVTKEWIRESHAQAEGFKRDYLQPLRDYILRLYAEEYDNVGNSRRWLSMALKLDEEGSCLKYDKVITKLKRSKYTYVDNSSFNSIYGF